MTNNEWAAQRRAGAAESRENNVIYIGRASFRMEPTHLLEDEVVGATPAPQVELIDHYTDRPIEPAMGNLTGGHPVGRLAPRTVVDENGWREMRADATRAGAEATESDAEAPYLRMRTDETSGLRTPPPLLDDLTDLAIPLPEPPATPPLPLMEVIAGAHLDPADETGVTLLAPEVRSRRVSLSRPWFASLGVLAFAAGLLTAGAAGVIARPVRVASAASSVAATDPTAAPATNRVVAAPPAEAVEAPLAVAAAEPPPAGPADAVEAAPGILPTLPARAVPGPRSAAAGTAGAKLRTRGNGAPARGRSRATKGRPEPHGESAIAQDAAAVEGTAPTESKQAAAPAAAAPRHRADWVDPFAE